MIGGQIGPICVSNGNVAALEDIQFALGQGPCQDAYEIERPVHTPRLDEQAARRWPAFVDLANSSGISAVFAYPLIALGTKLGVMTMYQNVEGDLLDAQHSDSLAVAEAVTETVLSMQDAAAPGMLAAGLDDAVAYRAEIHQASGMVAVQLQVPVEDALLRMRGHAFAQGRTIAGVAADIVARRLRLGDDRHPDDEGTSP